MHVPSDVDAAACMPRVARDGWRHEHARPLTAGTVSSRVPVREGRRRGQPRNSPLADAPAT